jgi:pimeloyl-ACP methyl ester carboxylesterase
MAVMFRGAQGLSLVGDAAGTWSGPVVLLLHGGGQTRHAWRATNQALAGRGFLSITLDLRGHGDSGWSAEGEYSISDYANDVRAVADQIGRPVALVGASLGGLSSLIAAGEEPAVSCSALVLVDVTPRMRADGQQQIGGFMQSRPNGFVSVDEAADAVAAFLPHRPRPADVSGLTKNLRMGEDGRFHWHWDPAFVAGIGDETFVPDRFEQAAASLDAPVLLVRGQMSEVVDQAGVDAFMALVPGAEFLDIPDAHHMVAGDRNDMFSASVLDFLSRRVRA